MSRPFSALVLNPCPVCELGATKTTIIWSPRLYLQGSIVFMRCSNCGLCCKETEMELSNDDVKKLEEAGYHRDEFAVQSDHPVRLRNVGGWCYFYSLADKNCRVYENRPLGCFLYPVVYLADEGAIVDELCPMGHTVSKQELRTKRRILDKLLKKIDDDNANSAREHKRKES